MNLEQALSHLSTLAGEDNVVPESALTTLLEALTVEEVDELLERLPALGLTVKPQASKVSTPESATKLPLFPKPMEILKRPISLTECTHLRAVLEEKGFADNVISLYCATRLQCAHRQAFNIIKLSSRELAWLLYEAEGPLAEIWRNPQPKKTILKGKKPKNSPATQKKYTKGG